MGVNIVAAHYVTGSWLLLLLLLLIIKIKVK